LTTLAIALEEPGRGLAQALVLAAGVYAAAGVVFAVPFVLRWVGRTDPAARTGTLGFRLAILPGAALFWPLLLGRVLRGRGPAADPAPHGRGSPRAAAPGADARGSRR